MYILCRPDRESDSEAEVEHAEKLRQVKAVLEEVFNFLNFVMVISFYCINNMMIIEI